MLVLMKNDKERRDQCHPRIMTGVPKMAFIILGYETMKKSINFKIGSTDVSGKTRFSKYRTCVDTLRKFDTLS